MNGDRAFKKARALMREPGAHQKRMDELLGRIKTRLADIDALLAEYAEHWAEEDGVYRFYHQSFKVFDRLQPLTKQLFELITEIGGEQDPPCEWYCQIVREGTEHHFNETTNNEWLTQTRPILEAFWHMKYFLTMMAEYAKQLDSAPQCLPSGWAAVLYLFELR
jgi:hypothetical protein